MDYVRLGSTGMKVSRLCLGCMTFGQPERGAHPWTLDADKSLPIIRQALEAGINFFDTANSYSEGTSEEILGEALRQYARRDEVVIATKVYNRMKSTPNGGGLSRKAIFNEIDQSLRRLGTDYVDLYQIHRWDPATPIDETLEALHDVVKAGKARYIGASTMAAWQFAKSLHVSDSRRLTRFVTMQNHLNLLYREEEREMMPLCHDQGIGVIPWSPLARGFLAGNRRQADKGETVRAKTDEFAHQMYFTDADFAVAERATALAKQRGVSPAQIALAWLLARPGVTSPIVGASKPAHLEEAVAALDIRLDDDAIRSLEEPYRPHAILGHS